MKRHIFAGACLAIFGMLMLPMTVFASGSGSGDTSVSGTLVTSYKLTPPDTIDLGSIDAVGDIEKGPFSISVSTNDGTVTTCGITAADKDATAKSGEAGRMADGSGHFLLNGLFLRGGDITDDALLTATPRTLRASTTLIAAAGIDDFYVMQPILLNDFANPGTFTMTLTFTATFN